MVGTLDPLEGSLLILAGKDRGTVLYWACVFGLIAVGVGALFGLSAVGGIGGQAGHSMWWGVLLLPYLAGWLMALAGGVAGLAGFCEGRQPAHA